MHWIKNISPVLVLWICRRSSIAFHMDCWLLNVMLMELPYLPVSFWRTILQRKQRVKLGSARSSWADLHTGVPQGSILGPLLFNVFTNDLFFFIEKCSLYSYVDDNTISFSVPCLSDVLSNLQSDRNHAIEWFNSNGMKANPAKFLFVMLSSSSLTPVELLLDSSTYITSQDSVKVLGIITDKQLTFNEHNSLCCTKAARKLNAFARISKYLNSRCTIHHSFIVSNFSYCPLVWHFCGKTNNA